MNKVPEKILNMLVDMGISFPCPGCRELLVEDGRNLFCGNCREMLNPVRPPYCPGCGGANDGVLELCSKCLACEPRRWEKAYALFELHGYGQELIHRFKYNDTPELARAFGALLAERIGGEEIEFDCIVPTPLHWTRRLWRGFNQSELVCRIVSRRTGIPLRKLLVRSKRTRQQAKLNRKEREKNLIGAFSLKKGEICENKTILLFDDVMTTGATLSAAVEVLLDAGAREVYVMVLGRR